MMLSGVASTVAAIPLMYSLMSANEYVTHRYYQHTDFNKLSLLRRLGVKVRGGGHVEHHAETLDDMTLKVRTVETLLYSTLA